jgi:ribosomal protein S18 acetylase RimI-like enzyme
MNSPSLQIEPLLVNADGATFFQLYRDYLSELRQFIQQYGNSFVEPSPWWVDDPDSQVHIARVDGLLAGFVINGWRRRVDPDTDSEILECYVAPAARRHGVGRRLAVRGLSLLSGRAGFQVYFDNAPAQHFWTSVLSAAAVEFRSFAALDRSIPVIKYRFLC